MRLLPFLFVLNFIVKQQTDHYLVLFLVPVLSIIPVMLDEIRREILIKRREEFWEKL